MEAWAPPPWRVVHAPTGAGPGPVAGQRTESGWITPRAEDEPGSTRSRRGRRSCARESPPARPSRARSATGQEGRRWRSCRAPGGRRWGSRNRTAGSEQGDRVPARRRGCTPTTPRFRPARHRARRADCSGIRCTRDVRNPCRGRPTGAPSALPAHPRSAGSGREWRSRGAARPEYRPMTPRSRPPPFAQRAGRGASGVSSAPAFPARAAFGDAD